jgi:hypothetical protein
MFFVLYSPQPKNGEKEKVLMKFFIGMVLLVAMISNAAQAQKIDKIVFAGPGMSSTLANGSKSASGCVGAKLVFHFGNSGWFSQLSTSGSRVFPQASGAKPYWSMRPSVSLGYRFPKWNGRLSVNGSFGETRNRSGDFLPTTIGGAIVRLKGRWGMVTDVSRNSQSWGTSTTIGYRF